MGEIMARRGDAGADRRASSSRCASKGETADEIAGCAEAMREHVLPVRPAARRPRRHRRHRRRRRRARSTSRPRRRSSPPPRAPRVAKHGNRAVSSAVRLGRRARGARLRARASRPSGSRSRSTSSASASCSRPTHHPAMRHAAPVRRELGDAHGLQRARPADEPGRRAGAGRRRLLAGARAHDRRGAGAARRAPRVRRARRRRDRRALAGRAEPRRARSWTASVREREIDPLELGIERCDPDELRGGSPAENAAAIRDVFAGEHGGRSATRSCSTPPARSPPPATRRTCARALALAARGDRLRGRRRRGSSELVAFSRRGAGLMGRFATRSPAPGLARDRRDQAALALGRRPPPGRRPRARSRRAYARAGAAAISVLVDERFGGTWDDLRAARAATDAPLLAKGFFSTEEHLRTAPRGRRRRGAAAAARPRRRRRAPRLMAPPPSSASTRSSRRTTPTELERAVALGAGVIGINARDLVDVRASTARAQLELVAARAARPRRRRRERDRRRARRARPPSSPAPTRSSSARR